VQNPRLHPAGVAARPTEIATELCVFGTLQSCRTVVIIFKNRGDYRPADVENNYNPGKLSRKLQRFPERHQPAGHSGHRVRLWLPTCWAGGFPFHTLDHQSTTTPYSLEHQLGRHYVHMTTSGSLPKLTLNWHPWEYNGPYSEANGQYALSIHSDQTADGNLGEVNSQKGGHKSDHFFFFRRVGVYTNFLPAHRVRSYNFAPNGWCRGGIRMYLLAHDRYGGGGQASQLLCVVAHSPVWTASPPPREIGWAGGVPRLLLQCGWRWEAAHSRHV